MPTSTTQNGKGPARCQEQDSNWTEQIPSPARLMLWVPVLCPKQCQEEPVLPGGEGTE